MVSSRIVLPLLAVAALAPAAFATQVVHTSTRELARSSSEIVIGKVESSRSYWNPQRTRILTDVTFQVDESLKGAPGHTLTLTQMGGEVDGVKLTIEGSPLFKPGEEALLFVWRDRRGRAQVNGLGMGKYEIERDALTGERLVRQRLDGLTVRDAKTRKVVEGGSETPRTRLDDLKREILRAIEEGGR